MGEIAAGVELGERVINRPVKQDPKMAVFIANVEVPGTGRNAEPTLILGRKTLGRGRSFMVPLSSAWQYNEPAMLAEKAEIAAKLLFGTPFPSSHEKHLCADVILQYLPELFSFAPDTTQNRYMREQLERTLSIHQVRITTADGKELLDASEGVLRG